MYIYYRYIYIDIYIKELRCLLTPSVGYSGVGGESFAFPFVILVSFFIIKHLVFVVEHSKLFGFNYYLLLLLMGGSVLGIVFLPMFTSPLLSKAGGLRNLKNKVRFLFQLF